MTIENNNKIEKYIDTITSPSSSSNPYDYIKSHQNEYDTIINMGDDALYYLLSQFENGNINNDLRGHIKMAICKDLLGNKNNVNDYSLTPQDWFRHLKL